MREASLTETKGARDGAGVRLGIELAPADAVEGPGFLDALDRDLEIAILLERQSDEPP
jgi:hypothetical protein